MIHDRIISNPTMHDSCIGYPKNVKIVNIQYILTELNDIKLNYIVLN